MIRYLAHHVVDDEIAVSVPLSCDERQRFDHEGLLFFAWGSAMVAEDRHRSVAGIAIENCELERRFILTVPGRVVFEFARDRTWPLLTKPRISI